MAKHITYPNRLVIQEKLKQRASYSEIANAIDKAKSTITYEIKNKSKPDGEYCAKYAQELTTLKRVSLNSLRAKYTNPVLVKRILVWLKKGRSPKHIAIRLKQKYKENKAMWISHETIYKIAFSFKHHKILTYCAELYKYLPRKNKKKQVRGYLNRYRASRRYWRSIARMSETMIKSFGVWQIDAMHIKNGYILVCVEVFSKKVMAITVKRLTADSCLETLKSLFASVDAIKAIICDRGSENTRFKDLQRMLNTRVYACDPGSPWQKGLVEGTIRLLRKYFPNSCDYNKIIKHDVDRAVALLNTMYRESLKKKTANQVYNECSTAQAA